MAEDIKIEPLDIILLEEEKGKELSTGDKLIDNFLQLRTGLPILVFGAAFTGKTTFCLQLSIHAAIENQKTYYLDTEGGVFPKRIIKIVDNINVKYEKIKKYIYFYRIYELKDFFKRLNELANIENSILVIDSLSRILFKELYASRKEELEKKYSNIIKRTYSLLAQIADKFYKNNSTLIFVSETKYSSKKGRISLSIPFPSLLVISKYAIGFFINKGRRYMFIQRHPFKPSVYEEKVMLEFTIEDKGLKSIGLVEASGENLAYIIQP